jgi:hypothetical protein
VTLCTPAAALAFASPLLMGAAHREVLFFRVPG